VTSCHVTKTSRLMVNRPWPKFGLPPIAPKQEFTFPALHGYPSMPSNEQQLCIPPSTLGRHEPSVQDRSDSNAAATAAHEGQPRVPVFGSPVGRTGPCWNLLLVAVSATPAPVCKSRNRPGRESGEERRIGSILELYLAHSS
jgi:hypothetical protein